MSASQTPTSVLLQQQTSAAFAAYAAIGSLSEATYSQLGSLLAQFQAALVTAQALQTLVSNAFDQNNMDALFASGVEPETMATSLILLQNLSLSMVEINNVANRLARSVAVIQLAQQGAT